MKKNKKKKYLKPLKIRVKHCPTCKHYNGFRCSKFLSEEIPVKVFQRGCKKYKKNKHLYF